MKSLWSAVIVLVLSSFAFSADVQNLNIALEEDGIHVGFALIDAFGDDVLAQIKSGLETTFTVKVRVDQDRELWFNRRIQERELRLSCIFDNVASAYRITKSLDGDVFESVVVDTDAEMRKAMTTVSRLKILDNNILKHNADYILRVKGELMSRYVLLVIPWDIDTPWREKHFTFN